jgi:hypothetical protein
LITTHIICFIQSEVLLLEKYLFAQPHTQAFLADELQHGLTDKPSDSSLIHILSCGDKLAGKPQLS